LIFGVIANELVVNLIGTMFFLWRILISYFCSTGGSGTVGAGSSFLASPSAGAVPSGGA